MRLQELFRDDDAVSPVIGVILMVAITVILAAVIASFVLGLGQQNEVAPQSSLGFDYDSTTTFGDHDGTLTVTHESGDAVVASRVFIRGDNFDSTGNQSWAAHYDSGNNGSLSGSADGQPAIVAGDSVDLAADTDYEVDLVWEAESGSSSSTLVSDDGPDA